MKRRSFLLASAIGALSALTGRVAGAVTKPANAFVKVSSLKRGRPVLVETTLNGAPLNVLVTMTGSNKFSVLDATCTHQGCVVRAKGAGLLCPCHKARYNPATGAVTGGPAPAPLAKVNFVVKAGYLCFA